jgi:hypothetical protein
MQGESGCIPQLSSGVGERAWPAEPGASLNFRPEAPKIR